MTITPLSEGSFTIDKTKQFIPFDPQQDELQERSTGSLLVEIQPFLIKTATGVLLLDTGLGFMDQGGQMQVYRNLATAGCRPDDISHVLLSHLHKDHSGAVTQSRDHNQLTFPNARYYLQERELNFAFEKGFPSFITDELAALKNSPAVVLLKEDEGMIDAGIRFQLTGAHSPFHQVFWIEDEGQTAFFGGDDAPQLQQMKHRFVAKYDFDGKKAMALRQQWWKEGKEKEWTFLFYHDIKNPVYRFNGQS